MVHELSQSRLGPILASVLVIGFAGAASAGPLAPPPIVEYAVPTANSAPSGITAGPAGNLWFTEFYGNRIGRITPPGAITEFSVPTAGSRPLSITAGPDGNVWFTESDSNCNTVCTGNGRSGGLLLPA
jgi:streptogramin lyase